VRHLLLYGAHNFHSYISTGSGKGKCRISSFCHKCAHAFYDDVTKRSSDSTLPGLSTFCSYSSLCQDAATLFILTRAVHPIGNVDFVGSDSLLKSSEYAEFPSLQMYPAVAGAVVPIFNIEGVDDLVLTPLLLSQIFRQCKSGLVCADGSVSLWNDFRIIQLNPQHEDALTAAGQIKVIVRSDKSGTTEIWKNSLSAFEPAFAKQIGRGESNTWLNASVSFSNLNEGVAATVLAVKNTIGYSVLAEARVLRLKIAGLKKDSGNVVIASTQTISFAVMEKGADFGNNGDSPSRLTADIHNAKGTKSSCFAPCLPRECCATQKSQFYLLSFPFNGLWSP
jgi:hypothetical protein